MLNCIILHNNTSNIVKVCKENSINKVIDFFIVNATVVTQIKKMFYSRDVLDIPMIHLVEKCKVTLK